MALITVPEYATHRFSLVLQRENAAIVSWGPLGRMYLGAVVLIKLILYCLNKHCVFSTGFQRDSVLRGDV